MLGGSSALNFLVFHRASAAEYDAWAELGAGKGWDWKGLLPFFRKSEDVLPSNPGQYPGIPGGTATNDRVHGRSGPLNVRFSKFHTDLDKACVQAFESSGIPTNIDPVRSRHLGIGMALISAQFGGNATGSYDSPGSINHRSGNRSYSATAYYFPNQGRNNLVVLTGALVGIRCISKCLTF
jgi:choline dehydrogenase-like flavoprotein